MKRNEKIEFFHPGRRFPAVSVTGMRCELMCGHCRGKHLKGMADTSRSSDLLSEAERILSEGGTGILISGGCDAEGRVPLTDHTETISKISEMGLGINVHSGFLTEHDASELVKAGVSRFSVDVHQDPLIIRNALHLDVGPEAYADTISNILVSGGVPVPHITAGFGTDDLVLSAEMAGKMGIKDMVLLALVKTKGTDVENVSEEGLLRAIDVLKEMGFRVTLGCMRPRGYPDLEIKAIRKGIRRIANPSLRTMRWAEEEGFHIKRTEMCCCMDIRQDEAQPGQRRRNGQRSDLAALSER